MYSYYTADSWVDFSLFLYAVANLCLVYLGVKFNLGILNLILTNLDDG